MVKFHQSMVGPFIAKADRIEKNLAFFKNEPLFKKLLPGITEIEREYNRIKNYSIPKIKIATGHPFSNPSLFLFVFLHEEINKVFNEAGHILGKTDEVSLPEGDIEEMKETSENRLTLAHIGDAALEIGVLASIWPQSDVSSIPRKKLLHDERGKLVDNVPLSQFWDSLNLNDEKILKHRDNDSVENKGTSMEAVFGIIYLESGLDAVEDALKNLKHYHDTKKGVNRNL